MKTFAYIVSGVLTLLILVVVVAPFLLDLNDYKGDIAAAVKDATGRDLAIDGDIAVTLFPLPTVKVAGVRFANLEGAAAPDMVRIGMVEASVALIPLLSGSIEVGSLAFIDPRVELEVLADGRANWRLEIAGAGGGSAGGLTLRIDSLILRNATLVYRDGVTGVTERLDNLNLEAAVDSINGPYRARGSLVARLIPVTFEAQIGALDHRPIPLHVNLTLSDADATVEFNGAASSAGSDAELSGKLKIAGSSLARLINILSGDGESDAITLLAHEFSLSAGVIASTVTAGINDIVFDIGGIQGTGAVSALLAKGPQIDVAIALNHVDLDKLLAASAPPNSVGGGDTVAAPFSLPGGVYATLDLRVNAMVFNQAVVRQAALVADLDQGVVTLQQASALLPGGSDVTLFGVLDAHDGKYRIKGQVEASADNLRAVLDWLDVSPGGVPPDRLRKLSLSSKIELTPTLAKVSAIDLRVDSSRLTGAANIGLGGRLAFNAIVALDQINLDAYLPAAAGDQGEQAGAKAGGLLALLGEFDAELKAKVGKLVYNGLPLSDIALDAGLRRGVLSIRSLRIADLAGADAGLAGTIDSTTPGFDVTYSVNAADAARLFQLADMAPPGGNLGGVVIRGAAKGDLAALNFDTTVTLSDAEVRFTGTLQGLAGAPRVDTKISLRADSLGLLARRFGTVLPDTANTPIALDGTIVGDVGAATVALTMTALGAELRLDGGLANVMDAPSYDLTVNLGHPDFVAFAESLGDDIRFARRDLGKVQISAAVAGDGAGARITDLRAELGPSRLGGAMTVRFDGPRPSIDADIAAGEIHTDLFQMVATTASGATGTTGATGGTVPTAGRWSRQPIDFSGLSAIDAKARVKATALIFRKYRFEDVALRLTLAGGALDIEELSGRLYGAPARLRARLTDTAPPTAALALTLQGADLKALLIDVAEVDAASGKLDLTARFQTRGRSELELISALGGEGTVAVRRGMVEGIDLGRLNTQLANIDNEIALIGLIAGALSGGVTPIHSLDGTFVASNGVVRSDDVRAVLDGGEGTAVTTIDLPRWQLSMNSEFRLTGHPNAPPVGLLLMGPIDNPSREIRDEALKAHITEKVFSTVARKVLVPAITGEGGLVGGLLEAIVGGGQAQQETVPTDGDKIPPLEPSAEPSPEQLFENLLQGIIQGN